MPPFLIGSHAVPVTVDEFPLVQRHYPIVFSVGENAVPLALMGLNEGVNTFVDDEGTLLNEVYVPAYVRRYPFMLARLRPESDELSLCFDPTARRSAISTEAIRCSRTARSPRRRRRC